MILNYVSLKPVIGRFLKDFGLEDTAYMEDIPQWTADAIEIIGIPDYYVYKHTVKPVREYKASLPCDIENLYGVWVSPSLHLAENVNCLQRLFIRNVPTIGRLVKTTNHASAYGTVDGGLLHTSFREGYVYYIYSGIPLDCDGYPLVPKDAKLNEALQYYFIWKMSLSGFKHPVIAPQDALQLWEKTYPAAGNSVNWFTPQELQEFTELWTNVLLGDLHANLGIH